jgi:leader peptidase (prepilin peptidase)/N-methyltransferase
MGDMVPVLSWLYFRGTCRGCGVRIPYGYLALEIALALLFLGAYGTTGLTLALVPLLAAFFMLAVIVVYDLKHLIVPSLFSSLLILFSFAYALLAFRDTSEFGLVLLQAGIIALVLFLFYALSRGRIMGLGDTPVVFALALLTGHVALSGLVFSFWIGALVGIGILLARPRGSRMMVEVPFVPFLAAGHLLAFFTQWNPFSYLLQ